MRYKLDADLHFEGSGETAYRSKSVQAEQSQDPRPTGSTSSIIWRPASATLSSTPCAVRAISDKNGMTESTS